VTQGQRQFSPEKKMSLAAQDTDSSNDAGTVSGSRATWPSSRIMSLAVSMMFCGPPQHW